MTEANEVLQDLLRTCMDSLDIKILNTAPGSSVMAIIVEEMKDSFLVGLPSRLVMYDESTIVVEEYAQSPYIFLYKSQLVSIVPVRGIYERYFLEYILKVGLEQYPDILTDRQQKELVERLEKSKKKLSEKKANASKTVLDQGDELPSIDGFLVDSSSEYQH